MEIAYLRYFQTVARLEHISRAAEELHITQSALSRAISRIENEVGASLFIREANRIHLNHNGRIMQTRVEAILALYDAGLEEISDATHADSGSVMVLSASEDLVSDCFSHYMLEHPKIQLFHRISGGKETVDVLTRHGADFAVTPPLENAQFILWKPLIKEAYILAVSRSNPLSQRKHVKLEELSEEFFIFTQGGTVFDSKLREMCRRRGFDPKVRFKGVTSDLPWELLRRGEGVMFLPSSARYWTHNSFLTAYREDLTFLDIEDEDCIRMVGLAVLRGGYLNNASRAAMQGVKEYYTALSGYPGVQELCSSGDSNGI